MEVEKKNELIKYIFVIIIIIMFGIIFFAKTVNLIKNPTSVFVVENGTVSKEESSVRIHYKR